MTSKRANRTNKAEWTWIDIVFYYMSSYPKPYYIWALHGLSCQHILDLKQVVIKIANRCKLKSTRMTSRHISKSAPQQHSCFLHVMYGLVHIQRNTITNMWKCNLTLLLLFLLFRPTKKKNSSDIVIYLYKKHSKVSNKNMHQSSNLFKAFVADMQPKLCPVWKLFTNA